MAGDWIKIRYDLLDDPAVLGMANALDIGTEAVVGHLVHFWIWVDKQCADGGAPGVTKPWLDRYVNVTGFTDALLAVGWLKLEKRGFTIPNFERHFGKCSKRRALASFRQQAFRKRNASSVTSALRKALPEQEQEQEQEQEKEKTAAAAASSFLERLEIFGFSAADAKKIMELPDFTLEQGEVAMKNAASKRRQNKLRNPLGYVRKAIEDQYSPLKAAETDTPWWENTE